MVDQVKPSEGPTWRANRRELLRRAAALGIAAVFAVHSHSATARPVAERRDLFPQGVASGDPDATSVILWTRRPYAGRDQAWLRVEVAKDSRFAQIIAAEPVNVSAANDWTCRVLVGNLKPSIIYWYRFVDEEGNASRVGRTRTAPALDDPRPARFAFVSCQNINLGALHAYRRMIFEDEQANDDTQIEFVLHLGDFIYEIVWYPEENPDGALGRRIRDTIRYRPEDSAPLKSSLGGKIRAPTTLEGYRTAYRAYLADPDLQDARARWPFVSIWDNHETSACQSLFAVDGEVRSLPTRKIASMQAWWEYQPARVATPQGIDLERFSAPPVKDRPVERYDPDGLGDEPNNLAALGALTGYRSLRWGKYLDLILTDQRSYRSRDATLRAEAAPLADAAFAGLFPRELLEIIDAGRDWGDGRPPDVLRAGERSIPNFRHDEPPQTLLGTKQKRWFLDQLGNSTATWKVWANSLGTLDERVDLQNLPADFPLRWHVEDYGIKRSADYGTAWHERAEIYNFVHDQLVTGFVILSGDRHAFQAGLAAPALPPDRFDPVGLAFVVGSISMPGGHEMMDQTMKADDPMRTLYFGKDKEPELYPLMNMALLHGVRSCLEYRESSNVERARTSSNPELAPHLSFCDVTGHGYASILVTGDTFACEFVAIPRPEQPTTLSDGGPVRYRVAHQAQLWQANEIPALTQHIVEGQPMLCL